MSMRALTASMWFSSILAASTRARGYATPASTARTFAFVSAVGQVAPTQCQTPMSCAEQLRLYVHLGMLIQTMTHQ
jgi:hypothetical protein